jgi:hypothetical protein
VFDAGFRVGGLKPVKGQDLATQVEMDGQGYRVTASDITEEVKSNAPPIEWLRRSGLIPI